MIPKKKRKLSLDKFINYALYDKNDGYYIKKIHSEKRVILLQHQISQDYFQK